MFRSKSLSLLNMAGAAAIAACMATVPAHAQEQAPVQAQPQTTTQPATRKANPAVGGAQMDASKTIVANASAASNLTTLVAAVKAAGLAETLSGPGPFTVFAPTNDAFNRLPPGTVDTLLKPENKETLKKILSYHVVPGNLDAKELASRIKAGGGSATLTTLAGQPVTVTLTNGNVTLTDSVGNKAYVSPQMHDVRQSNGIVHVINGVIVPTLGDSTASAPAESDGSASDGSTSDGSAE